MVKILSKAKLRKLRSPLTWMRMTEEEVHDIFMTLKGATKTGKGYNSFVYIPGTRKNKVVLIAHCDTVFVNKKRNNISFDEDSGEYFSTHAAIGIGADDRAGCAILWRLRNSGHSLLIPHGEERGCLGSRFLMQYQKWKKELQDNHQFMIQFDRHGADDLVFYDVGSPDFVDYLEDNLPGFSETEGIWSDVGVLCTDICGVNISTGYYNEHWSMERLNINDWLNTLQSTTKLLNQDNLPRFEQKQDSRSEGVAINNEFEHETIDIIDIDEHQELQLSSDQEWEEMNIDETYQSSVSQDMEITVEDVDNFVHGERQHVQVLTSLKVCEGCKGIYDNFENLEPVKCPFCEKES